MGVFLLNKLNVFLGIPVKVNRIYCHFNGSGWRRDLKSGDFETLTCTCSNLKAHSPTRQHDNDVNNNDDGSVTHLRPCYIINAASQNMQRGTKPEDHKLDFSPKTKIRTLDRANQDKQK